MFIINFGFRFKEDDNKYEHRVYCGNEVVKNEQCEKIVNRYSMYKDFKIRVQEIREVNDED